MCRISFFFVFVLVRIFLIGFTKLFVFCSCVKLNYFIHDSQLTSSNASIFRWVVKLEMEVKNLNHCL